MTTAASGQELRVQVEHHIVRSAHCSQFSSADNRETSEHSVLPRTPATTSGEVKHAKDHSEAEDPIESGAVNFEARVKTA